MQSPWGRTDGVAGYIHCPVAQYDARVPGRGFTGATAKQRPATYSRQHLTPHGQVMCTLTAPSS